MSAARRRAFVLPVVLVIIGLLALAMGGYVFFMRAELAGVRAEADMQQARLVTESGFQELLTVLRASPNDPAVWYDNPAVFRNVLVWAAAYEREDDPLRGGQRRADLLKAGGVVPAWRYSVVAANLDQDVSLPDTMRYGITPEAGKLNINAASEEEIGRLFEDVMVGLQMQNWPDLVAAFLDWRDEDDETRPQGAEQDYYSAPELDYLPKNGRLDSIEELLQIRGFSAAVLYGEDTNRNGILDPNEDDGDASFPFYDNADGILDHGLAPYITVWSRETVAGAGGGGGGGSGGGGQNEQGTGEEGAEGAEGDADSGAEGAGEEDGAKPGERRKGQGVADEPGGDEAEGDEAEGDEILGAVGAGGPAGGGQQGGEQSGIREGLVNVNVAPLRVLQALDGMTPEAAERIVALRKEQAAEALASTQWLVTAGALDASSSAVLERLTTKAYQFHVEIVGYADHLPLARRDEWVIELRGPLAQVLYHRDLTPLGLAWPVNDETKIIEQR